jgi:bifunctional non-homologous end joining protein LigD
MSLNEYRRKRHFQRTPEPAGGKPVKRGAQYLIQKHAASHLHYDFRLELDGVLKSWAVPKGPSLDPAQKSLAVHVEDHPLEYGSFEGVIPQGEYGGGTVMLWDRGTWEPEGDAAESYRRGKLLFRLDGERLKGRWALIRMGGKAGQDGKNWLLKKLEDDEARSSDDRDILTRMARSVASGRTMNQIAANKKIDKAQSRKAHAAKTAPQSSKPDRRIRKSNAAGSVASAAPEGQEHSEMPTVITPQLPLLVDRVPQGEGWLHELKLDGYRMICFVRGGRASLVTRRGNDWTDRFPKIAAAVEQLGIGDAILDGEIVALAADGSADFQALQNMMRHGDESRIVYYLFDLIYHGGLDLRRAALLDRKQLLSQLINHRRNAHVIRFNDHISGQGSEVFATACRLGIEGIVSKRGGSSYVGRRTSDWVKVKCIKRQEFVIGGWTEPEGARESLGALLLGYYNAESRLMYCGRVGTGFTQQSLHDLHQALRPLEQTRSPFGEALTGAASRGVHWVKPELVAEVAFAAWTADGLLRHAVFQGIREDKRPGEIMREVPVDRSTDGATPTKPDSKRTPVSSPPARTGNAHARTPSTELVAGIRLTHPDRILYPEQQITKRDLAGYYTAVASFILPHVVARPLSLVRCPDGSAKPCFFQRHRGDTMPGSVNGITVKEKKGEATYIAIEDLSGLISLVQMGVLEIHPWGSRADRLERPDRVIIDIDPADDRNWSDVVQAASHVKQQLDDLGLASFLRTTGGKGLHVVAPIERRTSWDDLKTIARAFVDALVRQEPTRYVATASKSKRAGKIYLDYLRNEQGATAIASYSTRARSGATVATPVAWDELSATLRPGRFTTQTVPERLRTLKRDPWLGFFEVRQTLTKAMKSQIDRW